MSVRHAVLIGIDTPHDAAPLRGAVQDVLDLARAWLARGGRPDHLTLCTSPPLPADVLPGIPRTDATTASVQQALARTASRLTEEDTALVHMSTRGFTSDAGPTLLTADGELVASTLSAAFAALPVRSVLVTLDAGFGGGDASTRTWGPARAASVLPSPADPTVLAGGLTGPVRERTIDGVTRGVFSSALAHRLASLPAGSDVRFAELLSPFIDAGLAPAVLPPTDRERLVGALVDAGPHVPWRGVQAAFQWFPTHEPDFRFSTTDDEMYWDLPGGFPAQQFQITGIVSGGPNPPPPVPPAMRFENKPFDFGQQAPQPPGLGGADRLYEMTATFPLSGRVLMLVRDVNDPQSLEWYTNGNTPRIDVGGGGDATYTPIGVPSATEWSQSGPWYKVHEARL